MLPSCNTAALKLLSSPELPNAEKICASIIFGHKHAQMQSMVHCIVSFALLALIWQLNNNKTIKGNEQNSNALKPVIQVVNPENSASQQSVFVGILNGWR
jgi:hypothetical protein